MPVAAIASPLPPLLSSSSSPSSYRLHFLIRSSHGSQGLNMFLGLTDSSCAFDPEEGRGGEAWGFVPSRGHLMTTPNCCVRGETTPLLESSLYGCASGASVYVWVEGRGVGGGGVCAFSVNDGEPARVDLPLPPSLAPWVRLAIRGDAVELRACERRALPPQVSPSPLVSGVVGSDVEVRERGRERRGEIPSEARGREEVAPNGWGGGGGEVEHPSLSSLSTLSSLSRTSVLTASPWNSANGASPPLPPSPSAPGTKPWPSIPPPSPPKGGEGEACSRKYALSHHLDFEDEVADGFVDAGRGSPLRSVRDWQAAGLSK